MKKISILGSTGSIGVNALEVIDHLGDAFSITALSANKNGKRLVEQAKKYHPDLHRNKPELIQKIYEKKFRRIKESFELLEEYHSQKVTSTQ